MKSWISLASHLFAGATSFVTLSVVPVIAYGTVALTNTWQSGVEGDPSSVLAVPVLSALGAAFFSIAVAPALSTVAHKWTQRFGWNAAMFPGLLACAATVALSLGNAVLGLHWSAALIIGGGLGLGVAFSAYWLPLRWAQRRLPEVDAKCGQVRGRLSPKAKPRPISLS
ncbi:hypothetical protein EON83_07660 [bacterium]|nr:MAG: hypothetical protein EON83_07660 [bacterium]